LSSTSPTDRIRIIEEIKEMIKPLVAANIRHLEKLEGFKLWTGERFHTDPEDRPRMALVNVLASICSHAYEWELNQAADLCFRLLEEVNMHTEAEQVAQLLKCWHHREKRPPRQEDRAVSLQELRQWKAQHPAKGSP